MNIKFQKARLHEAEQIKEIAKCVIQHNYVSFLGLEATNVFIDSGMSDKEIDDGFDRCIVMLCDDTVIGFAITNDDLLHLIMIDVPYQNRGYGGKLLAFIESDMFTQYKIIRLQSFQENANTVQFYLKKGWQIVKEEIIKEMDKTMLLFEKSRE